MTQGEATKRRHPDPSTEAGLPESAPGRDQAPDARMDKGQAKKEAPEGSDHSAAGQGLSG